MSNERLNSKEISLKDVVFGLGAGFRFLKSKWKIIFFTGIVGGFVGLAYSYLKKPQFTAECTFVLEDSNAGNGFSQYAGLASMVGLDFGGAGGNGIFQGDNIFELYKSRLMIEKTLLSSAVFGNKKILIIDAYLDSSNLRASSGKKHHDEIKFDVSPESFTLEHNRIIGDAVKDINKNFLTVDKPDKKLNIISVKVRSKDELFAKVFAEKLVENVNEFYIQTKTKRSLENVQILQRQADSVRRVLDASIRGAAASIDANPNANLALQILRVPSQRRQVDVQASSGIYAEVVKNLEISKISLRKETPLIQVIDRPVLPLKKEQVGKFKGLIVAGLLFSLLSIIIVSLQAIFKKIIADRE